MKFLLLLCIFKLNLLTDFHILEKMTKCLHSNQKIKLNNLPFSSSNGFTITFWIRATFYHNELSKKFLKIKNLTNNKEIVLTSKLDNPDDSFYKIYYSSNFIGKIHHSETPLKTFEEQDLLIYNKFIQIGKE